LRRPIPYLLTILCVVLVASLGWATPAKGPKKPAGADKCPVCGMFVAKYPDFAAQIQYSDGSTVFFDGAKDMFKYLQQPAAYRKGKQAGNMTGIYVTDYYSLAPVDGVSAWYVSGSDIYGPMGHELVPFGKEKDAREFMKDHKGKRLLRFREVTPQVVKGLD